MRGLLLVAALLLVGSAVGSVRRMKRNQQKFDSDTSVDVTSKWNFNIKYRALDVLPAPAYPTVADTVDYSFEDKLTILKVLTMRNARFDASIGIASQHAKDLPKTMAEVLDKVVCIAKAAHPLAKEEDIYGGLFALPGSQYEKDWLVRSDALVAGKGKPLDPFKKFDIDRWGPFLPGMYGYSDLTTKYNPTQAEAKQLADSLAANIAAIKKVVQNAATDPNFRPFMHLFARLSIYGEKGLTDWSDIPLYAKFSFRHALHTIYQCKVKPNPDPANKVCFHLIENAKSCGLNMAKVERVFALKFQGKSAFEFELFTPNNKVEANSPVDGTTGGKFPSNIAESRTPRNPSDGRQLRSTIATGGNRNTWTAALMAATHMPPFSDEEIHFVRTAVGGKYKNWDPVKNPYDELPGPPGAGGNVFDMISFSVKNKDTAGNNRLWHDAQFSNGFIMSGGPSGTTDEAMQMGDYTSVSSTKPGCCILRNGPLANMVLFTHHTYVEVAQGAGDGNRECPMFSYADPYGALETCDQYDGVWTEAKKIYRLMSAPRSSLAATVKKSDYGMVAVSATEQKPRRGNLDGYTDPNWPGHYDIAIEDEGAVDPKGLFNALCDRIKKSGKYAEFPGGKNSHEALCL